MNRKECVEKEEHGFGDTLFFQFKIEVEKNFF